MIKKILFLMLFVVVILLPSCTTDYSSPNTTITQSVSSVYQPAIPITQLTTVESQTPPETIIKIVAISGPPIVLDSKRMDIIDLYVKNTPAS